jgi:ribonuclease R
MEIDSKGKVLKFEIYESIINSKARLVYDDVSDILENEDESLKKDYNKFLDDFTAMEELCVILEKKREKRGCIDFDFDEAKIILDENDKVVNVEKYERRIANKIIEEFMIVCNETIAEIIKGVGNIHPKEFQSITKKVKGKKEETVINTIMLRSLKKAVYSSIHENHFGLASEYYCHFTSPIRRYPDLQIHRIIKYYINGVLSKKIGKINQSIEEIARMCSVNERKAEQLEREVDDIRIAEYMHNHIGEEYEGIISSVTSFGVFVELDNTIEGLVHISNMADDYYFYDENNYCLLGERTKKSYKIGDIAKVKLVRVNIQKAEIDFIFIN